MRDISIKKWILIGVGLMTIAVLLMGLFWLTLIMLVCSMTWFFFFVRRHKLSDSKWTGNILLIPAAIALVITFRLFIVSFYHIPTSSMETTLLPGDFILVSKMYYGPLTTSSLKGASWLNLLFRGQNKAKFGMAKDARLLKRFKGLSPLSRHDVVVFKYPKNTQITYIKRCVGLAGDTLQLSQGKLSINGKLIEELSTVMNYYQIWSNDSTALHKVLDFWDLNFIKVSQAAEEAYIEIGLSFQQFSQVKTLSMVDSISPMTYPLEKVGLIFPNNESINWSLDEFGPLMIPRRGMQIKLSSENMVLYQNLLEQYEHVKLEGKPDGWIVDGKPIETYTFKNDYYFMMGDNRHNTLDSRHWGFVPEHHVIGKAILVVWSKKPDKIRWRRIGSFIK